MSAQTSSSSSTADEKIWRPTVSPWWPTAALPPPYRTPWQTPSRDYCSPTPSFLPDYGVCIVLQSIALTNAPLFLIPNICLNCSIITIAFGAFLHPLWPWCSRVVYCSVRPLRHVALVLYLTFSQTHKVLPLFFLLYLTVQRVLMNSW